MSASASFEVLFRVHLECEPGDVVCVTGDCQQLGAWDPHKAVQLYREAKDGDNHHEGDVWSRKMLFNGPMNMKYRYLTARITQSEAEDKDEEHKMMVTRWETHIRPRVLTISDAMKETTYGTNDKFGFNDGEYRVSPGWLVDQSQITLHLQDNPIQFWNRKYKDKNISVKCTPLNHRNRDEHDDEDGKLPTCLNTLVTVSLLKKDQSTPVTQGQYGMMYTKDSHMMFSIHTLDPEHTGLQLDFYCHSDTDNANGVSDVTNDDATPPKHVGYSFILPLGVKKSNDHRTVPMTSPTHNPLGEMTFDYLLVRPMIGQQCRMDVSYQHHWKSRQTLEIGHRGMGISHEPGCKTLATTRENTIQSMMEATSHGADYIELDVQLTQDKAVVANHNLKVNIEYKKKKEGQSELLQIPVKDFTLSELQHLKVVHSTDTEDDVEDLDTEDVQPFPTLERCFQSVDIHTGFNIEVKYPQWLVDIHELEHYIDRNEVVDTILKEVYRHHDGRRIIFSSFDCDTCIALGHSSLRMKQNRFPVLFLTQGDTTVYSMYRDTRTRSVEIATEFCLAHSLLGVDAMSELLFKDTSRISYVKDSGLVLFTWGEDNNDTEIIEKLKQLKVDAIIYDRIDHFKTTGKENIFKVEMNEKIQKLQETTPEET